MSAGAQPPVALSPFVAPLAEAARDRLLVLLDLGDRLLGANLGPHSAGSSEWLAEVSVRLPSGAPLPLRFAAADPHQPALFRTRHLSVSYTAGGVEPFADAADATFLHSLRARLVRADATAEGSAAAAEFLTALERYRPFLPVKTPRSLKLNIIGQP